MNGEFSVDVGGRTIVVKRHAVERYAERALPPGMAYQVAAQLLELALHGKTISGLRERVRLEKKRPPWVDPSMNLYREFSVVRWVTVGNQLALPCAEHPGSGTLVAYTTMVRGISAPGEETA